MWRSQWNVLPRKKLPLGNWWFPKLSLLGILTWRLGIPTRKVRHECSIRNWLAKMISTFNYQFFSHLQLMTEWLYHHHLQYNSTDFMWFTCKTDTCMYGFCICESPHDSVLSHPITIPIVECTRFYILTSWCHWMTLPHNASLWNMEWWLSTPPSWYRAFSNFVSVET